MVRVFFKIEGPIKCPECNKFITPLNLEILEQTQEKATIRCPFCGNEFEIEQKKPDFYTIT